jgi:crotonobetainyl-CoA:carnitine CoA-transferase CaiB-like acyl-CoA transferase
VLGHPEWAGLPEFIDSAARVRNRHQLADRIEAITSQQPCSHWLELFEANDIPCGPISDYAHVLSDPQIVARGMVVETDHPTLGKLRTLGSPIKLSDTPAEVGRPAPGLGEHTVEVLTEAGFSQLEIDELRR